MHTVIINGSPRVQAKSNTEKILEYFLKGYAEGGNTYEIWRLSDRKQWEGARDAFLANSRILFALPLFVENIPGLMLEFLEELPMKAESGTEIAFLLQGGFPEAAQLRCCESFLETLPEKFNCGYAGTLIKGDMFGVRMMPEKAVAPQLDAFAAMGRVFAETGRFGSEEAAAFAGAEKLPASVERKFNHIGRYMQRLFMNRIAKSMGCKTKLDAAPYAELVK